MGLLMDSYKVKDIKMYKINNKCDFFIDFKEFKNVRCKTYLLRKKYRGGGWTMLVIFPHPVACKAYTMYIGLNLEYSNIVSESCILPSFSPQYTISIKFLKMW